jgi:hypothetical protein
MSNLQTSTLRPGLLVSLKTSVRGNVSYNTRDIEFDHVAEDGTKKAKWETERVVADPIEHEAAIRARGRARSLIASVCAQSAFGMLCPESAAEELDAAIGDARKIVDEFNSTAKLTRLGFYIIAGRIAPDDVEAVKAINSEIRDLLADMERGVANLEVKVIRDAAAKAKAIGAMLQPEAAARVRIAVDAARSAARQMVKAGEQAAVEVDRRAIRAITEARTAFLDLDGEREVAAPAEQGRAIDFQPEARETFRPRQCDLLSLDLE